MKWLLRGFAAIAVAILAATVAGPVRRLARIATVTVPNKEKDEAKLVRVGILGTPGIAKFAVIWPAGKSKSVVVQAVASRDRSKAVAFADLHGIPEVLDDYAAVVQSRTTDAVYIGLPTKHHFRWTAAAIRAGKHVIVEKPITSNAAEAAELAELARKHGVVVMEGYHYRYHPVLERLTNITNHPDFGGVSEVLVDFTMLDVKSYWRSLTIDEANITDADREHSRYKMLDRWCYCADMVTTLFPRIAGVEVLAADFSEPGSFAATLEVTPRTADSDGAYDSSSIRAARSVRVTLRAGKHAVEVPRWDVVVRGRRGNTTAIRNFGFPFAWHRLETASWSAMGVASTPFNTQGSRRLQNTQAGTKRHYEYHYGAGETTFEHQLDAFVKMIRDRMHSAIGDSVATMELIDRIQQAGNQRLLRSASETDGALENGRRLVF